MSNKPKKQEDVATTSLAITDLQFRMMHDAEMQVATAQEQLRLIIAGVLAGHGVEKAELVKVEGGDGSRKLAVKILT